MRSVLHTYNIKPSFTFPYKFLITFMQYSQFVFLKTTVSIFVSGIVVTISTFTHIINICTAWFSQSVRNLSHHKQSIRITVHNDIRIINPVIIRVDRTDTFFQNTSETWWIFILLSIILQECSVTTGIFFIISRPESMSIFMPEYTASPL